MKKGLDKELYPDYVYPEFTPDPNEPFREPIAKLGKKITDRIPQKLGLKKITRNDPEYWGLCWRNGMILSGLPQASTRSRRAMRPQTTGRR